MIISSFIHLLQRVISTYLCANRLPSVFCHLLPCVLITWSEGYIHHSNITFTSISLFIQNGKRQLVSWDLDTQWVDFIQFYIRIGGNTGSCNTPDSREEGVLLQYSNNGGITWNLLSEMYFSDFSQPRYDAGTEQVGFKTIKQTLKLNVVALGSTSLHSCFLTFFKGALARLVTVALCACSQKCCCRCQLSPRLCK